MKGLRNCNFSSISTGRISPYSIQSYYYYLSSNSRTIIEGNNYLTPVYDEYEKRYAYLWSNHESPTTVTFEHPSYWGSSKESIVRKYVWDIEKARLFHLTLVLFSNCLNK